MITKLSKLSFLLIYLLLFKITIQAQSVSFTAPDTVCVNTPIKIVNQTQNGTSFYWNFDIADH